MAPIFRFPRPRSFLHIVSLQTATEFINLTLLINKVTGFYGILAIFTGYHLNPLQLSHYIYSLTVLLLILWLAPSVSNRQAPLKNLASAWIYVIDTVINCVYTALFSAGWFFLLAEHDSDTGRSSTGAESLTGKQTMGDTAGFTDPKFNATHVEVVAKPAPGVLTGQEAIAYGYSQNTMGSAMLQSDSLTSIIMIGLLVIVRIYFCIVVMAHARSVLRLYVARNAGTTSSSGYGDSSDPTMAESPFRPGREMGMGWQGKLGRLMVRFPTTRYWLGRDENAREDGERLLGRRFDNTVAPKLSEPGVGERERRARSGTGPPLPGAVGKQAPN